MHSKRYLRRIPISILLVVLIVAYLLAFFWPGVWHGNTFLYQKDDSTFVSYSLLRDYTMQKIPTASGTDFSFAVDNKTEQYRVVHNENAPLVQIYKNDIVICEGAAIYDGKQYMLKDDDGNLLEMGTSGVILITEDCFPSCSQLVNWSLIDTYAPRGNFALMYILLIVAVLLCLCYVIPKYSRDYESDKPTTVVHKYLRWSLWAAVVLLALLSLFIH